MSNNVIDTNVLGNKVTSMKTRSNMAKILKNLHIFKNFWKSSHQFENDIKYGQNCQQPTYFQKCLEIKSSV